MKDTKETEQVFGPYLNPISYHIREIKDKNTYGFIVEKQVDFNCFESTSSNLYVSFFANIIPAIGTFADYALQLILYKAENHYNKVDGCSEVATGAAIALVEVYKLSTSPILTVSQTFAYVSLPWFLISLGYSFLSEENSSFQKNINCGEERDKLLSKIGCPPGWKADINFPDTQITLTCTPPKELADISLLRAICDGNKFIEDIRMQNIATLENEVAYDIAWYPNIKSQLDCQTDIVTGDNMQVNNEL